MSDRSYVVYILASGRYGTLYVGVTSALTKRIWEHRTHQRPGFTTTYGIDRLVWWRGYGDVHDAIAFEKKLKRWRRDWKIALVEDDNPDWTDLYPLLVPPDPPCHPGRSEAETRDP